MRHLMVVSQLMSVSTLVIRRAPMRLGQAGTGNAGRRGGNRRDGTSLFRLHLIRLMVSPTLPSMASDASKLARRAWVSFLLVVLLLPAAAACAEARQVGASAPNSWSPTGSMRLSGRGTAMVLPDGRVLVLGDTRGQVYTPAEAHGRSPRLPLAL